MNIFYFLEKYFDKLDDVKFRIKWEKYFQRHLRTVNGLILLFWIILTLACGSLLTELSNWFFGFILMVILGMYFAFNIFVYYIRFLAKNNTRYMTGKVFGEEPSYTNHTNDFSKDDVVETIKK